MTCWPRSATIASWRRSSLACRSCLGMTCVDLGFAAGAFTRRLCRLNLKLTGMDISPRSIDRARVLGGGPEDVVGDISQSLLPPATFDFAVLSGVLHHLTASEDRVRTLREALRL